MSEAVELRTQRRQRLAALRAEVEQLRRQAKLDQRARRASASQRREEALARATSVAEFLDAECRRPRTERAMSAAQSRASEAAQRRREVAATLRRQRHTRRSEGLRAAQARRSERATRSRTLATFRRTTSARARRARTKAYHQRLDALCRIYAWVERVSGIRRRPPCADCRGDSLRSIEGIGPKCAELLRDAGLSTFRALATTSVASLRAILEEGGPRFRSIDPSSWPEQAHLAATGDTEGLKHLQDRLVGGRRPGRPPSGG